MVDENIAVTNFASNYKAAYTINKLRVPLEIFVDSWTIVQMILGFRDSDQLRDIDRDRTLVHSFLYNGLITPCHLAIPHQNELLRQLDSGASFTHQFDQCRKDEVFNKQIKRKIHLDRFSNFSNKREYIDLLKEKIRALYVSNYVLQESNWAKRLKFLNESGRIVLDSSDSFEIIELIEKPLFRELKKGFDYLRKETTKNNTTDALVLCLLSEKLNQFQESGIGKLPLFYDFSGTINEVIEKTQTRDEFLYFPYANSKAENNDPIFIIADSKFILINFIFHYKRINFGSNGNLLAQLPGDLSKYHQIFLQYNNHFDLEGANTLLVDPIEDIDVSLRDFIDLVLLKEFWEGEKDNSIEQLIKSNYIPEEELNDEVIKEVDVFSYQLRAKLKNYILYNEIYNALENALQSLCVEDQINANLHKFVNDEEIDVLSIFGLTKFSIHPNCKSIVKSTIRELLTNTRAGSHLGVLVEILSLIRQGISDSNKGEKLGVGLAALWILGRYKLIIEVVNFLPRQEKYPNRYEFSHYSNAFFYAGSLIKTDPLTLYVEEGKQIPNWKELIDEVFTCVQSYEHPMENRSFQFEKNYQTSIAAAYINFEIWKKMARPKTFLTRLKEPNKPKENDFVDQFLINAVQLLKRSITWMEKEDNYQKKDQERKNYYYCLLHKYIYYITMGFDDSEFNKLGDEVGLLSSLKPTEPGWEHRFDHTLALYNLRRALILKDDPTRENKNAAGYLLEFSKKRIETALNYVIRIDDYQEYIDTSEKIKGMRNNMFIGLQYRS